MIKHIVMWRLHDTALGADKQTNARRLVEEFAALQETVPDIAFMEIGINFDESTDAADVVLNSAFATREHLRAYQEHPAHKRIVALLAGMRSEKRVVDYEV